MESTTDVTVHKSAYPETVRERIVAALGRGELHPSLLYSGLRQTLRWTALHHSISPAQQDAAVGGLYDAAFTAARGGIRGNVAHVVSLACGDGSKDVRCLSVLRQSGRAVLYTPADISLEMVLSARRTAAGQISGLQCTPLLCDLAECTVLPAILKGIDPSGAERLLLFFGTVHNYWPPDILKAILYPLRSQDWLLLSANLAPAEDYSAALERIMVQYDNEPTRHWLMGALSELDLSSADGELRFSIEAAPDDPAFQRIVADFVFTRRREITLFDRAARFSEGQKLRVFYSWRFTRGIVCKFLQQAGLAIEAEWITPAREEGVFLCRRAGSAEKQLERSVGVEATQ